MSENSSVPYLLVILISVFGWLTNSTISELQKLRLLEYEIEYQQKNGVNKANISIQNRSKSQAIMNGNFTFTCLEKDSACFTANTINSRDVISYLGGGAIKTGVSWEAEKSKISSPTRLIPQAEIRYSLKVVSPNSKVLVLYELPANITNTRLLNTVFRKDYSMEGWLINNFTTLLVFTWAAMFSLFFLIWLVRAIKLNCCPKPQTDNTACSEQETFDVIVKRK